MVPRMLLPPSGPKSNCRALGLRFSEENWLKTPWADTGTGGLTDARTMSTSNRPLVESLNGRSREVSGEDCSILLSGARPADRAPLAQPQAVSRPRTRRDEPRDGCGVGTRPGVVPVGRGRPGARRTGVSNNPHHLLPGNDH